MEVSTLPSRALEHEELGALAGRMKHNEARQQHRGDSPRLPADSASGLRA